jgi:hypothetical protein
MNLALTLLDLEKFVEAEAEFKEVIRLKPNSRQAQNMLEKLTKK